MSKSLEKAASIRTSYAEKAEKFFNTEDFGFSVYGREGEITCGTEMVSPPSIPAAEREAYDEFRSPLRSLAGILRILSNSAKHHPLTMKEAAESGAGLVNEIQKFIEAGGKLVGCSSKLVTQQEKERPTETFQKLQEELKEYFAAVIVEYSQETAKSWMDNYQKVMDKTITDNFINVLKEREQGSPLQYGIYLEGQTNPTLRTLMNCMLQGVGILTGKEKSSNSFTAKLAEESRLKEELQKPVLETIQQVYGGADRALFLQIFNERKHENSVERWVR